MSYITNQPQYGQQGQQGGPQYIGFAPPNAGYPPPVAQGYGHAPPGYGQQQAFIQPGHGYQHAPSTGHVPQPPSGGQWMQSPMPQGMPNCPAGLEYLTTVDQLLVHQKVEMLEAFIGFESANKYSIKNSMGQKIYNAFEDNDCCTRNCCGALRPFDMKILDNSQREVIHIYRPLRCDSCLCPCYLQTLEVYSQGNILGYVNQEWSICVPKFKVQNASGETVLRIEGPFCTFSMCGDVEFQVLSRDGAVQVGKITKQWAGLLREAFTDADHFGVTFPMDLDVNIKAVLLGATFLIDFMFFEKTGNKDHDRPGMF